jgi:hypothetical protein
MPPPSLLASLALLLFAASLTGAFPLFILH